jgi:mono/diheme cytochrome c family protein
MRRASIALAVTICAVGLAGCGSQGTGRALPETVVGSLPKAEQEPTAPAFKLKGDPAAGAKIFASAGCGGCHTLSEAHTNGTVGPNLDQAHPTYKLATTRVTFGKGAMPSFKGQLSDQQIADVASYVVKATGGEAPGSTGP